MGYVSFIEATLPDNYFFGRAKEPLYIINKCVFATKAEAEKNIKLLQQVFQGNDRKNGKRIIILELFIPDNFCKRKKIF